METTMENQNVLAGLSGTNSLLKSEIPLNFQCTEYQCEEFALFAQTIEDCAADTFSNRRCQHHVNYSLPAKYIDIKYNDYGISVVPASADAFVVTHDIIKNAVDERLPIMVSFAKVVFDTFNAKNKAKRDLDSFKEKVVETVVAWDGGCQSGKTEFLEELGLEWPSTAVTITISFEYKGDAEELSSSDFEYAIAECLSGEYESMYCDIDY